VDGIYCFSALIDNRPWGIKVDHRVRYPGDAVEKSLLNGNAFPLLLAALGFHIQRFTKIDQAIYSLVVPALVNGCLVQFWAIYEFKGGAGT
jgi:hypothetical protein